MRMMMRMMKMMMMMMMMIMSRRFWVGYLPTDRWWAKVDGSDGDG